MLNILLIIFGKTFSKLLKLSRLGDGSTWPGHIALMLNKKFVAERLSKSDTEIIFIAGTNGKTTTARLIRTVLEESGKRVLHNESGANLLNGIASVLILESNWLGGLKADAAIFEIDENTLPQILREIEPDFIVLLNLFRDQLDRYGEINTIVNSWRASLQKLPGSVKLILNADDAQIANLADRTKGEKMFFGIDIFEKNSKLSGSADSIRCPKCANKLSFINISFSHLGDWECKKCGLKRPRLDLAKVSYYPVPGLYNKYNILAAALLLNKMGLSFDQIGKSFRHFKPVFGRQEVVDYQGRRVQIFLSKNPTGFNQSYATVKDLGGKVLLLVLNDRIPDGRDVSWIWDVDLPGLEGFRDIIVSGDRGYDMGLRIKYEIQDQNSKLKTQNYNSKLKIYENLKEAVDEGVRLTGDNEFLFVLPTYSAMLEVRKILTGKKIL